MPLALVLFDKPFHLTMILPGCNWLLAYICCSSVNSILPEKPKLADRSRQEDFARAMEDFTRRTKKLESEFLR